MANPARLVTQVVLVGGRILARAFLDAYRAAAANSKSAVAATATSKDALTRLTGMELDEAKKILDVERLEMEEIKKKYEKLFEVNDPKNGGSFYLQSKVFRAKERIELELKKNQSAPSN